MILKNNFQINHQMESKFLAFSYLVVKYVIQQKRQTTYFENSVSNKYTNF